MCQSITPEEKKNGYRPPRRNQILRRHLLDDRHRLGGYARDHGGEITFVELDLIWRTIGL